MIDLPDRLSCVFSLIPEGSNRVIDVGSDHGKMALACLQSGLVDYVVCTDIHKEPSERTRRCLADFNYSSQSEVYCTDGLDGVALKAGDAVVIAGMGGNTIIDIISRVLANTDKEVLKTVTWCLQPQKSIEKLRYFLASNHFNYIDEKVCVDRDIYYQMMSVIFDDKEHELSDIEAYYGPVLLSKANDDGLIQDFYKHLDDIYNVRARGDEDIRRMLVNKGAL